MVRNRWFDRQFVEGTRTQGGLCLILAGALSAAGCIAALGAAPPGQDDSDDESGMPPLQGGGATGGVAGGNPAAGRDAGASSFDAAIWCGSPNKCSPGVRSTGDAPGSATSPGTLRDAIAIRGTLVTLLAQDANGFIPHSHKMELFNADTGRVLGITTSSQPGTGQFQFDGVPAGVPIGVHVVGNGPADKATSTYDAIQYYAPNAGEMLLRINNVGTASVWGTAGAFTPRQDRAQLAGVVYRVDAAGKRVAPIDCAQVFLDDQPHPAEAVDQRYVASSGLPTTLDKQSRTLPHGSGKFYFGNLAPGLHSLRVSVDGGQTFLVLVDGDTKRSFFVPWTRAEASGNYKEIDTFLGIDVPGNDPTPANCPAD